MIQILYHNFTTKLYLCFLCTSPPSPLYPLPAVSYCPLVHDLGGRYQWVAEQLVAAGYDVFALDLTVRIYYNVDNCLIFDNPGGRARHRISTLLS